MPLWRCLALAAGAALVSSQSDPWSDLESCHKPTDEGCESCCDSTSKGTVVRTWTGNCTGCVPGAPCEPGNCPCGNCFPGVQPWWNEESFLQPGQEPPKGCKPCSKCTRRIIGDFIQTMFDTPQDGPCKCPDPEATPPGDGDCSCGAPGVACCDCQCQYKGDMQVYCGLDPTPATFPGPCAFDKLYNTSRGDPFTAKCDSKGYYDIIDCGPVAPPPLPPSPPEARAEMRRHAAAHPVVHHRRVLDEAPPRLGLLLVCRAYLRHSERNIRGARRRRPAELPSDCPVRVAQQTNLYCHISVVRFLALCSVRVCVCACVRACVTCVSHQGAQSRESSHDESEFFMLNPIPLVSLTFKVRPIF
eukprot:COSAG01_NODE_13201_length_1619_cov_0.948095_1_plen_359_part_00